VLLEAAGVAGDELHDANTNATVPHAANTPSARRRVNLLTALACDGTLPLLFIRSSLLV